MSQNSTDETLASLLLQLNRQLVKQLSGDGLPADQWRVLSLLAAHPDGVTMGRVCEMLDLLAPSATKLVDRMVVEGLLYRAPDPHDRRIVIIMASDKGRALFEETNQRSTNYEERLTSEFEAKDVRKLQAMLGHLLKGGR